MEGCLTASRNKQYQADRITQTLFLQFPQEKQRKDNANRQFNIDIEKLEVIPSTPQASLGLLATGMMGQS